MKLIRCFILLVIILTIPVMLSATEETSSSPEAEVPSGMMTTKGVIVERSLEGFTLRDERGSEITVAVTAQTVVEEKKINFLRKAIDYSPEHLLLGLKVHVEGHGDISGDLVADEIKFTQDDLTLAQLISSRLSPVEGRVQEAHARQDRLEESTQVLTGHIRELSEAFGIARGEAGEAQESAERAQRTADRALSLVNLTNKRVTGIDEFKETKHLVIQFDFDSANLSANARAKLDGLANQTKDMKGFMIEVRGFASSEGDNAYNIRLSQRRAELVVRYLVDKHQMPLRRMITPHGYGELNPTADESDLQGRKQNRRVEVRVLINQGLESTNLDSVQNLRSVTTF
jgi:outer membrane protein OmpA-like peptidoglycan-associated protein